MNTQKPTITPIQKAEFEAYARWLALPSKERQPSTQYEFAEKYGIRREVTSIWKHSPLLWEKVREYREEWTRDETSDVISALARRAKRTGDPNAVKLWMELVEEFVEDKGERDALADAIRELIKTKTDERVGKQTVQE